ncbi:pyocin knob domain-containing protein [Moellerella wisconsensis]|uniref:pyocin knob domain-containing protein n=1 Tax=Moellerella wisconsensis TaxID=158849 RepID=UPI0025AFDAA2|nr:pyocin knob domain-containing protein [Moellerella wisconsensis]WJW82930.1 pyocin knob domain-containing protein [Moellerella wisconsensis]
MYSTGKITTTANTTKVVGTNTKWKDNNSLISPEQVILIQNGATIYINSIASIQSNTEMTLSFPVPATVKEATYNILTTMVHSVSDAANKIVAMNNANVQFSDILNRWATETGTITVTLPDGTKQQLRTAKEMDKQLDGKFDKTGGMITASNQALAIKNADDKQASYFAFLDASGYRRALIGYGNGTDDLAFSNTRAGLTFKLTSDGKALIGNSEVVLAGDFGWGGVAKQSINWNDINESGLYVAASSAQTELPAKIDSLTVLHVQTNALYASQIAFRSNSSLISTYRRAKDVNGWGRWYEFYTEANTTKDSNGNLKAASPIVKVFADYIELNDESEGVELKCLHTGIYQLKHVLGLNSDASWGGINGGITIPSGINQLPLIYVDYDVLVAGEQHPFNGEPVPQEEHGDIVIYTSYRKHFDLPQNVQRARLKTYPEFTKLVGDERVELENGAPVDIPAGHWIDVRVNMPSNSIYNQKQAEAEAYAKEEAERVAREEMEASKGEEA